MQRTPTLGSRAARKAAKKDKRRSEKSLGDEDPNIPSSAVSSADEPINIPSAPTETTLIHGEPTVVMVSAAAQGSSREGSVRSGGPLPDLAPLRPLSTGSEAFNTPLLGVDDVSEVTDDFKSRRSLGSRRSGGTRVSLTKTEYSLLVKQAAEVSELKREFKDEVRRTLIELREAEAGQMSAATPLSRLTPGAPLVRKEQASKLAGGARKTTKSPTVVGAPPVPPNDPSDSSSSEGGSTPSSESSDDLRERKKEEQEDALAKRVQGSSRRRQQRRISLEADFLDQRLGVPLAEQEASAGSERERLYAPMAGRGVELLWDSRSRLAPKGAYNGSFRPPTGADYYLKSAGVAGAPEELTVRYLLDWAQLHVKQLVQGYYSIISYVDEGIGAQMDFAFSRCKFPELLLAVPRRNISELENHEFFLVLQLLVRPKDSRDFIAKMEACIPLNVPQFSSSFEEQDPQYNFNMKMLMNLKEEYAFLCLSGGQAHAPRSMDFKEDSVRKVSIGFGALLRKYLRGFVAENLQAYFRKETQDENTSEKPPNFGGRNKPRTAFEMVDAVMQIYEYFRSAAVAYSGLRVEYEGPVRAPLMKAVRFEKLQRPRGDQPRSPHYALNVMQDALAAGNTAVSDALATFAEEISGVCKLDPKREDYDSKLDRLYAMSYDAAMATHGRQGKTQMPNSQLPCFTMMYSPDQKCTKPGCDFAHDTETLMRGVIKMVAKAARTSYYEMAVELGYVTPFKILEAFHGSHIPQSARAIVSGGAPSALEIHSRSISSSDIYLSLVGGE